MMRLLFEIVIGLIALIIIAMATGRVMIARQFGKQPFLYSSI